MKRVPSAGAVVEQDSGLGPLTTVFSISAYRFVAVSEGLALSVVTVGNGA